MKDQAKRDAQTVQIAFVLFPAAFVGLLFASFDALVGVSEAGFKLLLGSLLALFLYRVVRVARSR